MGGASTQIAFVPAARNILANKFPVRIAGVIYSVYVHSYLIYGQEEVDNWIRRKVVEDAGSLAQNRTTFENPCMLNGKSYAGHSLLNIHCQEAYYTIDFGNCLWFHGFLFIANVIAVYGFRLS